MPRRKRALKKHEAKPDPKYDNLVVSRFISGLMWDGKRSLAERLMYNAMEQTEKKLNKPAAEIFVKALDNARPEVEVKTRRVGGANYQVPVEVLPERRTALGIRWIITAARERNKHGMVDALSSELMDAYNNTGGAVKKKEDVHKMAEANKAFAHYRW